MSILNKVLKDLDKRGQKPGEAEHSGGSAVAGPPSRIPWLITIAAVVLFAIAIAAGYISWKYWAGSNRSMDAKTEEQREPRLVEQTVTSQQDTFVRPETQPTSSSAAQQQRQPEPEPAQELEQKPEPEQEQELEQKPEPSTATPSSPATAQPQAEQKSEPAPTLVKKSVKLSPNELIQREITAAQEAAEKGLLSESATRWQKVLSIDPQHIEARRQLAALHFGRNRWQDALQVLTTGLELNPKAHELRLLAAKMLQKREQPQLALRLLQQAQPPVSEHLEYYRLTAQLAQQLSQWTVMSDSYEALTQAQPTQGRWWLGYAVASQQLDEVGQAIRAFKRAKTLIQHAPTLDFIEQQLNLLVEQDEATSS